MIGLIDFNDYQETNRTYGGNAGRKASIIYQNSPWIIKYPGNLKEYPDIDLDYSTSPITEYIGSHIYNLLEIPVHETILGTLDGKTVVCCKDFCENDKILSEFKTFIVTYRHEDNKSTDGDGTILSNVLSVIYENRILQATPGVEKRFWDMFVVDAFIGNPDRNNGNWGLLLDFATRTVLGLAPVYDNGNCLNSKWDDARMINFLKRASKPQRIMKSSTSIYLDEEDNRINPFIFINSIEDKECLESVITVYENIDMDIINNLIEDLYASKLISQLQTDFYQTILTKRYDIALTENYEHAEEFLSRMYDRLR